jgi:hypothetical protein
MSPEFRRAVVDTVLPGEAGLPSGSAAGVTTAEATAPILLGLAAALGGEEAFANASEAARTDALRNIERERPDTFRSFVAALLSDYYESPVVLTALGWSTAPPQPHGHPMPQDPDDVATLLERVQQRGALWRR